jgi:hypothetical protein
MEVIVKEGTQRASPLVLLGFIIMFLGAGLGVVGKMLIHVDAVTVVGILVSLAGMFLTVYPYLSPSRRTKTNSSPNQEVLTQSQPKNLHESRVEYLPSVTERTTDLLKNPATRPKQEDSGDMRA